MGDLGYEQQEAVISYNRVESIESADALAVKVRVNSADNVANIIESSGFFDYTFNENTKDNIVGFQ